MVQRYQNQQGAQMGRPRKAILTVVRKCMATLQSPPSRRLWQKWQGYCRKKGENTSSKDISLLLLAALGSQAGVLVTVESPARATRDASPCPAVTQTLRPSGPSQCSTTALPMALSLISMTSPRNLQPQRAALAPSFVEFDMSVEGYGYDRLLYI